VRAAIRQFCLALHNHSLDHAYAFLSPHYQQTITSVTDLPKVTAPFRIAIVCSEPQGGIFFTADNAVAHDLVTLTVTGALGTTIFSENVKFVKSGDAWLVDHFAT
jgi:hypothetical protein